MAFDKNINIKDYNYPIDNDRIASYPAKERDESKLLVYNKGIIETDKFLNISNYLEKDSLLVFNNTKVIQARLKFQKSTGAEIEIFCLEPYEPKDYQLSFSQTVSCKWICTVGNLKKWKSDTLSKQIKINDDEFDLFVEKIERRDKNLILSFYWNNNLYSFSEIIEQIGLIPIPPYLNRNSESIDKERYQTIYSKIDGSVAAPTAGLHFTENVFRQFENKNIVSDELTLHVGAGTFRPVSSELISEHEMHTEHFIVKRELIENLIKYKGKVISVGTTSMRTLESIYWLGLRIINNIFDFHIDQFEPYDIENNINPIEALEAILLYMDINKLDEINASTQIMIIPGYKFRIVDNLITNFHQPKSTLLLLVSAFIGDKWKEVYEYALAYDYRFLSYGDSSLLIP